MARIPDAHLDFLFRRPTIEPTNGWNSTVHLVRRECQETLANIRRIVDEDAFPGVRPLHRLFASAIVICSAFDLLAKLRYGDESGVGRPFQKLLVTYGGLSGIEARRVYDSRNALVHSFGVRRVLPAMGRKANRKPPRVSSVRIRLTSGGQSRAVARVGGRQWQLSVPALYRLLTIVIGSLERDLRASQSATRVVLFERMFVRYGRLRIR
jgi:hypothetical protein